MSLFIQDPDDPDTVYLLEELLEATQHAHRGGGVFAFATAAGARLLLEDEAFAKFAAAHSFDLVVGVDGITDEKALGVITNSARMRPRLNVLVFLHDRHDAVFHPKFCWFRGANGGKLIVGSGNLTMGGLRDNWEAFNSVSITKTEAAKVEAMWLRWMQAQSRHLLPPNDARVIERAAKNTASVRLARSEVPADTAGQNSARPDMDEPPTRPIRNESIVLIAEIPKSGDRWNQANFDLQNYERFFGAKRGTQRRIVLQHVGADGALGKLESRPSVAVASHNYRFELDAASGKLYPRSGRPIGVFVNVGTRTFRYRLLMPRDTEYRHVLAILKSKWTGPGSHVRRVTVRADELRKAWPGAPLWASP